MKFNRAQFCKSILQIFSFLAKDYALRKKSTVVSYEFLDKYRDDDKSVSIYVAHPELPHVELTSAKEGAYYFYVRGNKQVSSLQRRYYRNLEKDPEAPERVTDLYRQYADLQAAAVRSALDTLRKEGKRLGPLWKRKA